LKPWEEVKKVKEIRLMMFMVFIPNIDEKGESHEKEIMVPVRMAGRSFDVNYGLSARDHHSNCSSD
jgi:hypothetical protein